MNILRPAIDLFSKGSLFSFCRPHDYTLENIAFKFLNSRMYMNE